MKTKLSILILALLCGWPNFSEAARYSEPYIALHGGAGLNDELELDGDGGHFNASLNVGSYAAVAAGSTISRYSRYADGRLELELAWRSNELDEMDFLEGSEAATGDLQALSLMVNSIAEYRMNRVFLPYVGIGAGWSLVEFSQATVAGYPVIDADDSAFSYQLLAGVVARLTNNLNLDVGYRYLRTLDLTFNDLYGRNFEMPYSCHTVAVGLRLDF